jgi:hypothetical protein
MKFALTREQRFFFQEKGFIEFDEFISKKQIDAINKAIDEALSPIKSTASAEEQFLQGRDLWRRNDSLRKWASFPFFGEIIADLTLQKPIRLGYDQILPGVDADEAGIYYNYLNQESTLAESSCVKGIVGALILCLSSEKGEPHEGDLFPYRAGSAIFLGPNTPWDRKKIFNHSEQRYYLIVYTEFLAWYQLQPNDAHTHNWKQFGYIINEQLTSAHHPIVFR